MRSKRIGTFTIGLLILVSLVGLLLANQIGPIPTISAQAISTVGSTTDIQYALFYKDENQFYGYLPGKTMPTVIVLPSQVVSHFSNNSQLSVQWSEKNNAFLVVAPDEATGFNTLYRISEAEQNSLTSEQIMLKGPSENSYVSTAQWSPDGKNLAVVWDSPNYVANGGDYYLLSLSVYTPDGKLKAITSPDLFDAEGQPTMLFTKEVHDLVIGTPKWSSDGKHIVFTMGHEGMQGLPGEQISYDTRFVDTSCITTINQPCKIHVIKTKDATQTWSNFSWLPDNQHLIFDCAMLDSTLSTQNPDNQTFIHDICSITQDGTDFRHLSLPGTNTEQSNDSNDPISYAISPDGRTLAYTQRFSLWIYIYDIASGQIIQKISTSSGISFMVWIPVQSEQALIHLPTATPTGTPSMKLSLKPVCLPANRNSLHQDIWQWEVLNPNPVPVTYSIDWYDILSKKVETATDLLVQGANNGIAANGDAILLTQPGPSKVHLYVDGILQDEQSVPPLPCPGSTATPNS